MDEVMERYNRMYEFENDPRLYGYRFKDTGISMWMYIRAFVINSTADGQRSYRSDKFYEMKEIVKKGCFEKYAIKNPFLSGRKEILFAFWGYNGLKKNDNGMVYDPLIMPYLQLTPEKTEILMDGPIINAYGTEISYPNWKVDDIFWNLLKSAEQLTRHDAICGEDQNTIRSFLRFLCRSCPLEIDYKMRGRIAATLGQFAQDSKIMIKIFEIYLDIVKPKVVIICCGSYPGILRTPMILACRNKKIITAELQHGWVTKYYPWSWYSDYVMENHGNGEILPDYFLTYGEYWRKQTKTPQKCEVIGYANYIAQNKASEHDILFCAGINFDKYICLLDRMLAEIDPDITVYFRFHPAYTPQKQKKRFEKYLKYSNFVSADSGDIAIHLEKCRYVVVDASTVAYEALFMGRIVFGFSGSFNTLAGLSEFPDFHLFDSADEFMNLWNNRSRLIPQRHEDLFALNYKENYIKFLKKCGVDIRRK